MLPNDEEDREIQKGIDADPDTFTIEEFDKAKRGRPLMAKDERKIRTTIMLDRDIIERLKEGGRGWQTRANEALREVLGL
ncbi:MAG: hypothetical protein COA78_14880 [Blastopirellula sp.]|nr:MAG: hypothetical protein COA78_14880 [Blastopirellula sp.]